MNRRRFLRGALSGLAIIPAALLIRDEGPPEVDVASSVDGITLRMSLDGAVPPGGEWHNFTFEMRARQPRMDIDSIFVKRD